MNRMSAGCQYKHPFQFYSDVPKDSQCTYCPKNPVEALLILVKIIRLLIVGVAN